MPASPRQVSGGLQGVWGQRRGARAAFCLHRQKEKPRITTKSPRADRANPRAARAAAVALSLARRCPFGGIREEGRSK